MVECTRVTTVNLGASSALAASDPHGYEPDMDEADRLQVPLQCAPHVVAASTAAIHGERGIESYRLDRLWCLNLYQGEGVLRLLGRDYPFHTGCASITPPGTEYRFTFACRTVKTWIHFAPQGDSTRPIAIMQDLARPFTQIRASLAEACVWLHGEPERATARIWDALWRLSEPQPVPAAAAHPVGHRPGFYRAASP